MTSKSAQHENNLDFVFHQQETKLDYLRTFQPTEVPTTECIRNFKSTWFLQILFPHSFKRSKCKLDLKK